MHSKPSFFQLQWRQLGLLLLVLSSLSLSACFKDQPSEDDIKAMVSERFDRDFVGIFTTSNVVKNNGYKQNDTHYVAAVTITGTAQQSLDEYAEKVMQDKTLNKLEKLSAGMTIGLLKLTMPAFKAGDVMEFERNYLFIKTDNGWMLSKELTPDGNALDSDN